MTTQNSGVPREWLVPLNTLIVNDNPMSPRSELINVIEKSAFDQAIARAEKAESKIKEQETMTTQNSGVMELELSWNFSSESYDVIGSNDFCTEYPKIFHVVSKKEFDQAIARAEKAESGLRVAQLANNRIRKKLKSIQNEFHRNEPATALYAEVKRLRAALKYCSIVHLPTKSIAGREFVEWALEHNCLHAKQALEGEV